MTEHILSQLTATIAARRSATADNSYTKQLLEAGPAKCAKKLGEEAVENRYRGAWRKRRGAEIRGG